jgi:phosphate transport system protein
LSATSSTHPARPHFQEELRELEARTLEGIDLVLEQLDRSLEAVAHQDVELASMVIADDDRVDGRYLEIHQGVLSLLARQSPVAGDLRVVAALLHVIRNVERMGDQCVNICKLLPLSGNEPPTRPEILAKLARMGEVVRSEVSQSKRAFADRDVELAEDLVRQDSEVNQIQRDISRARWSGSATTRSISASKRRSSSLASSASSPTPRTSRPPSPDGGNPAPSDISGVNIL